MLTGYLDPEQYGQLALGLTAGVLVCQVVMGGVIPGIMRYYPIAAEKQDLRSYFSASRSLMLYATVAALTMGLMLLGGLIVAGFSQWLGLVAAAIILSLLGSYNTALSSIQNAARKREIVAFHGSLEAWLKVLFALGILLLLDISIEAIVVGYLLSSLVVLCSQLYFLRGLIPEKSTMKQNHSHWMRQMWMYSWPFVCLNVFTWAQTSSDRWSLELFVTTEEVGLYAVLFQLGYVPASIAVGLLTSFIAPILHQRSGDASDHSRNSNVHRLGWQATLFILFVTALGFLFAFGLHEWIFQLLVSPQYRSVSYLLPWLVLAGGLFSAGQMLSLKLMSDMKTLAMLWPKVVTAIIGVALNFYGAYIAGLHGIVAAAVVFAAFHFVWLAVLARQVAVEGLET